jgi:hypothetical protein
VLAVFAAGLGGVAGGGWLGYSELARTATHAEIVAASQAEAESRWERLAAGQIFPAAVRYAAPSGLLTTAYRVGIAPRSSCSAALDPPLAAALDRRGCTAVLRGTYTDASRAFVVTAGVAVMPNPAAAQHAVSGFGTSKPQGGVKWLAFPGTVADIAGTAQNDWFGVFHSGPYVLMFAAGATDGEPVRVSGLNPALADLAFEVERTVAAVLTEQPRNPCQDQDIQC